MTPYRSPGERDPARVVDFDDLLPGTQARLAQAANTPGRGLVLWAPGSPWAGSWALLSTVTGAAAALLLASGYGELSFNDIARRDEQQAQIAALLTLCVATAVLARRAQRPASGGLFRPGLYLFGRELVDARTRRLRLLSVSDLASVEFSPRGYALTFTSGARYQLREPGFAGQPSISVFDRDPVAMKRAIEQRCREAELAEASGDEAALLRLDPLALERPRWEAAAPAPRRNRWASVALALTLAPAAAVALALLGGRLRAIEKAVRNDELNDLAWFSCSDRLLAGWADRRWAAASLASGRDEAQVLYAQIGQHPGPFVQALEARLGDCSDERRKPCLQALRALCQTRSYHPDIVKQGLTRIDPHEMLDLEKYCRSTFILNGWSVSSLHDARLKRAVDQLDTRSLWALRARSEVQNLHERERDKLLDSSSTPTARMLGQALDTLKNLDQNILFRVETGGALYGSIQEQKAYGAWRERAAVLLRDELRGRPAGKLLRLSIPGVDDLPKPTKRSGLYQPELVANIELVSVGPGSVQLRSVTWLLRLPEPSPDAKLLEGWEDSSQPTALDGRWGRPLIEKTFQAPLSSPLVLKVPGRALPEKDDLKLLDRLL